VESRTKRKYIQQRHPHDVSGQVLRTERLLNASRVPLFMASITLVIRPRNRREGRVQTFETTDEIAHRWQLLTHEQQISLGDQSANNHEDLSVLLERLFEERKL